jgi:hypothetical protein
VRRALVVETGVVGALICSGSVLRVKKANLGVPYTCPDVAILPS